MRSFKDIAANLAGKGIHEVWISPDEAREILSESGYNWKNRNRKPLRIAQYARDMANGRWVENGDTIKFATTSDGRIYLADGQNRLYAVIEAGRPMPFIVVTGLADSAQETMDRHAGRTIADAASLRRIPGITNYAAAVALANVAWVYEMVGTLSRGKTNPSSSELLEYMERNTSEVAEAVTVSQMVRGKLPIAASIIGGSYFLCKRIPDTGPEVAKLADQFFVEQLIQGLGLQADSPAKALRTRLENMKIQLGNRNPDPLDAFRYVITAWNYFRTGAAIVKLQRPKSGWDNSNLRFR